MSCISAAYSRTVRSGSESPSSRPTARLSAATRRACPAGVYPAISVARASEAMVCRYVTRTAAYRRKDSWVSSRGSENTGSAHSPTTATAERHHGPGRAHRGADAEHGPQLVPQQRPERPPVRACAIAAASTASHSAVSTSSATSSRAYAGPPQLRTSPRLYRGWKQTAANATVRTRRVRWSAVGPRPRRHAARTPGARPRRRRRRPGAPRDASPAPAFSPSSAYDSAPAAPSGADSRSSAPLQRVSSPTAMRTPKARAVPRLLEAVPEGDGKGDGASERRRRHGRAARASGGQATHGPLRRTACGDRVHVRLETGAAERAGRTPPRSGLVRGDGGMPPVPAERPHQRPHHHRVELRPRAPAQLGERPSARAAPADRTAWTSSRRTRPPPPPPARTPESAPPSARTGTRCRPSARGDAGSPTAPPPGTRCRAPSRARTRGAVR